VTRTGIVVVPTLLSFHIAMLDRMVVIRGGVMVGRTLACIRPFL
jgi:hypothetical protein